MIDDVGDFVAAADILKERGAYKIYIMATHGLLSGDAPRLLEESAIDEVKPWVGGTDLYPYYCHSKVVNVRSECQIYRSISLSIDL